MRGGVEPAFMSTTRQKEVAVGYAGGLHSKETPMVFKMEQGMVNRGAEISWLSFYPFEEEVLFSPLTCIELRAASTQGNAIVLDMNLSINLLSPPIEKVVAKLKVLLQLHFYLVIISFF